jgi:hypothetical protein
MSNYPSAMQTLTPPTTDLLMLILFEERHIHTVHKGNRAPYHSHNMIVNILGFLPCILREKR